MSFKSRFSSLEGLQGRQYGVDAGEDAEVDNVWNKNISPGQK
jgi:hypothetical protein